MVVDPRKLTSLYEVVKFLIGARMGKEWILPGGRARRDIPGLSVRISDDRVGGKVKVGSDDKEIVRIVENSLAPNGTPTLVVRSPRAGISMTFLEISPPFTFDRGLSAIDCCSLVPMLVQALCKRCELVVQRYSSAR
jgi:hypothetical protein